MAKTTTIHGLASALLLGAISWSSLESMPHSNHFVSAPVSERANLDLWNLVTE